MRILMLGEFSGFYVNLKKGLVSLGHDVTLLGDGDGWKSIKGADGPLLKTYNSKFSRIYNKLWGCIFDQRFYDSYDIVMIIDLIWFYPTSLPIFLRRIKAKNKLVFLSSCGEDYACYNAYMNRKYDYYVFDDCKKLDYRDRILWNLYGKYLEFKHINKYICSVIPTAYEYMIGYQGNVNNVEKSIPLPIDLSNIVYKENITGNKIVIFHGLNRETEKGTKYIVQALKRIQNKYPDSVEIIIKGHMPYNEYVELLSKTNIVIDQCKAYSYGMNALVSLAQGKVVLGCAREETLKEYGINQSECPIVHIKPDSDYIFEQIDSIIQHKELIREIGEKGRLYVEKYHDSSVIAKKYEMVFKKYTRR